MAAPPGLTAVVPANVPSSSATNSARPRPVEVAAGQLIEVAVPARVVAAQVLV
ncbi:MAG: hypothetical protein M3319_12975 [Actinomycetota bacterium]|nr:hypothetical protein [Actinomycetota bacterium]